MGWALEPMIGLAPPPPVFYSLSYYTVKDGSVGVGVGVRVTVDSHNVGRPAVIYSLI